jgi:hypothetical protein
MKIIRRDIELILQTMNRFKLTNEWDGVNIIYNKTDAGYSLSIKFHDNINETPCIVEVPIEQDMFGD